MLEQYSHSYCIGKTYIDPIYTDTLEEGVISLPRISTNLYIKLKQWYQQNGSESDPVFKLGESHFSVVEGEDIPSDTLKVPIEYVPSDMTVPGKERFLVMKPQQREVMDKIMDPSNINPDTY